MPWYKNAVFYEIYLRAFYDSNGDGHGDLRGLMQKLDYLQKLGVDCLWLMPLYPSPLKDDGYDISDYCNIHPDYGTLDDFKALIEAAHTRNLRLILDLVINHTSDQHPWFQAARERQDSRYRNYYVWSDDPERYKQARIIFCDTETSNWAWDAQAGQYYWHRFYACQPDLNYDNPAVQAEILDVMRFWLDLGVDGFRVDAVPYLFEREGTNCENLPETHAFLQKMRRFVDKHYPDRLLLCEANQWPRDVRAYFGDENDKEFHMAFHFPLMPRLFMALAKADYTPIRWALEQTPSIPDDCQWCTFLRNHDELTLEMVTPEEREWMWQTYAPKRRMRLNLGIRRRLAPLLSNDRRKIELLNSLLFTLPGTPILYYGDEIGMGDNLNLPDRNGLRTPMQWDATPQAGFSTAKRLYAPPITTPGYRPQEVNVAAQMADPQSLWHTIQHMIRARKQYLSLQCGTIRWLEYNDPSIAAFERACNDQKMLLIHNLSCETRPCTLTITESGQLTNVLTGQKFLNPLELQKYSLAPWEYLWLLLS